MMLGVRRQWALPDKPATLVGLGVAGFALVLCWILLGGSKHSYAAAVALAVFPFCCYLAAYRPMIFPFGLFALLLPFDNLLDFSTFGTLTKLIAGVSAICVFLWTVRERRFIAPPHALFVWIAFLGWAAATSFWALNVTDAIPMLVTYVLLIGLFGVMSVVEISQQDLWFVFAAVVGGGLIAAIYGAYYYHTHAVGLQAGDLARLFVRVGENRSIDPNHFANGLLLPLALVLTMFWSAKHLLLKAGYCVVIVTILAAMYFAASRGAFVGVAAMFAFFLFYGRHRLQTVVTATLAALVGVASGSSIVQRFAVAGSSEGAGRLSLWRVGYHAFTKRWLSGWGVGNYQNAYDASYLSVYQDHPNPWHFNAHDLIVYSSVEFGIIGLILVLAGFVSAFLIVRSIGKDHPLFDFRIAVQGAIIAMFIVSLTVDVLWYKYLWMAFIAAALVRSAGRRHVHRHGP
ncbi:MAG TPA: O-antigen ligase family protein [Candidatus Dormibacteraeota bacterium]|nr:O-antigen ligase family protein [Candidatus Dormibacteraeota bacterium]